MIRACLELRCSTTTMVFSPQHGKRELYFILTMFVSRAVKRIINSMGPLVGFFDSPRVNGDAYFCFLWINFLIELGPCLDPEWRPRFGGTVATVFLSEHCSNFCFLVQKIVQKLIN
jgi:hypothetical protein